MGRWYKWVVCELFLKRVFKWSVWELWISHRVILLKKHYKVSDQISKPPFKDTRFPILKKLKTATGWICKSNFKAFLFSADFSLAYLGFLRVGEVTHSNTSQARQIIINKIVSEIFDAKTNLQFIKSLVLKLIK